MGAKGTDAATGAAATAGERLDALCVVPALLLLLLTILLLLLLL